MLSLLSSQDLKLIQSYIQEYAQSCDAYIHKSMAPLSHILRFWADNKSEYLSKAFGNQLILERDVEFSRSAMQLRNEIQNALEYGNLREFKGSYHRAIEEEFGFYSEPYYYARSLINSMCLATNSTNSEYTFNCTLEFRNGNKISVGPNMKTMRVLGKVCKELHLEEEFESFRLKHSLYLNQKKLKGTLCLSIHPLDYLTMSDNDNGWSSCMSWKNDGDYRGGTVEMLNSKCVIVAYLKSEDKTLYWNEHKWNSKLWRCLILLTPEVITSVKPYPYYNEDLIETCISWVRELATNNLGWNFYEKSQEIVVEGGTLLPNDKMVKFDFCTGIMYNDFGTCEHRGYVSPEQEGFVEIDYSGPPECIICGSNTDAFYDHNFVACEECCDSDDRRVECYECGETYYDDDIYWVEDRPLCEYCFNNYADECALSNEYYFNENLFRVFLARTDNEPDDSDESMLIGRPYLQERFYSRPYFVSTYCTHKPRYDEETGFYYWNISDWTEEGLKLYWSFETESSIKEYIQGNSEN